MTAVHGFDKYYWRTADQIVMQAQKLQMWKN